MKPYIEKNTKLRMESKSEFEKNFYKLMNNSVYGKTMKNVKNHRDAKLITNSDQRKQLTSQPNYHTCKDFQKILWPLK